MSSFLTALIGSGTILAIVLATDLGRKRITTMRLLRAFIAVAIVIALFVRTIPTGDNEIRLQLIGLGAGVVCGLLAGALLPAHRDSSGEIYTTGGIAYALLWGGLSAARVVFAYGSEHWFGPELIKFSIEHRLSGQAVYANAFIFMALAMVLARSAVLFTKRHRLHAAGGDRASRAEAGKLAAGSGL